MNKRKKGRDYFRKYKRIINAISKILSVLPLKTRKVMLEWHRYTRGLYGIGIRYILVKTIIKECGDNVLINEGCFLVNIENMCIGDNVSIQQMCYIDAAGGIRIGSDVSIAHGTTILSSTHNYSDINECIKNQGLSYKMTIIKDNVWIGAKSTVLNGVVIDSGAIIGAGSVVNRDVKEKTIVAGSPAKYIKNRDYL